MLITSIQRFAAAHTAEATTSTVDIPSDEMKGRIIGREGRNIRAFEKATGVDVIIDDTPGVVIVSAFDPVRREIARISLNKLIADGRIHPSRIEELVAETQKEIEQQIQRLRRRGRAGSPGSRPATNASSNLLGRLHYRTSYSQNVLRHSIEVAFVAGMMAEEMGMDGDLARRAGLLHDIGKAADHDMEGGHPQIGADLLKRYGEGAEVVHAALGHHDDIRADMPYTVLVAAADACSASRPGARRETLDRYIKRMQELETIATGFQGVEQAFAIQAGREVRVIASTRTRPTNRPPRSAATSPSAFEEQLTLSRRNQGDDDPRNAVHGDGEVDRCRVRCQVSRARRSDTARHPTLTPISMRILFIGDIVGKPGRDIVCRAVARLVAERQARSGRRQRRKRGRRLGADAGHLSRADRGRRRCHHARRPRLSPQGDLLDARSASRTSSSRPTCRPNRSAAIGPS